MDGGKLVRKTPQRFFFLEITKCGTGGFRKTASAQFLPSQKNMAAAIIKGVEVVLVEIFSCFGLFFYSFSDPHSAFLCGYVSLSV